MSGTKKKIKRLIQDKLAVKPGYINLDEAMFQDIDGPADDLWQQLVAEMFPHLAVPRDPSLVKPEAKKEE